MEISYLNGKFLPKDEIMISPDDRGFLFADGIYEVVRWYAGSFYDMEGHVARMKRSLREVRIIWPGEDSFPDTALELINRNHLTDSSALIYLQVTRGAAPRAHYFPDPPVPPTVYAFARKFKANQSIAEKGVGIMLKNDIRWARCDIKSVALLPNTLSFQEAKEKGYHECVFVKNGFITEGSHSNIFFVRNGFLYTHPESENILSGITRKNIIRIARESGINVIEEAVKEDDIASIEEAFVTNTTEEATPVVSINGMKVGNGRPGTVTGMIRNRLFAEINPH
jgi:D-alanine transaminase